MAVVSAATFERLLRGLDQAGLVAFVSDLWTARGRDATLDGNRIRLDDGTVVRCVAAGRFRQRLPHDLEDDVDIVVTAWSVDPADASRDFGDVAITTPDDLRDLLLYAIDRDTAGRLFERHFDRPLTVPDDPASWRGVPAGRTMLGVVLIGLVVTSLAMAAGAGIGGLPSTPQATITPSSTTTPTATSALAAPEGTPTAAGTPAIDYPPGVTASGITDLGVLATAHLRFVADTRWDLRLRYEGASDRLNPDRQWAVSRQTVERESPYHYWYKVTGHDHLAPADARTVIYDEYATGSTLYRRVAGAAGPRFERSVVPDTGPSGLFATLSVAYVQKYLATSETEVDTVHFDNRTWFELTATGSPYGVDGLVTNYEAIAYVDSQGFIKWLAVTYERPLSPAGSAFAEAEFQTDTDGDTTDALRIRFVMEFRDVDTATVELPPWYANATAATGPPSTGTPD